MKRAGSNAVPAGAVCTLTIRARSIPIFNTHLFCTMGVTEAEGDITPAGTNRVHILGAVVPNVYGWRVSGRLLTFTKISDIGTDRVAAFSGTWMWK